MYNKYEVYKATVSYLNNHPSEIQWRTARTKIDTLYVKYVHFITIAFEYENIESDFNTHNIRGVNSSSDYLNSYFIVLLYNHVLQIKCYTSRTNSAS